jgi:GH35 family endo-1,4-beta-xylanase
MSRALHLVCYFLVIHLSISISRPAACNTYKALAASEQDHLSMAAYQPFGSENPYDVDRFAIHAFIHASYPVAAKQYLFDAAKRTGKRLMRQDFALYDIEPTEGQFTWSKQDENVRMAEERGLSLLGTLGYAAPWIADPRSPNRYLAPIDPNKLDAFAEYVRQTVRRYPQVRYWEIWNEPNQQRFYRDHPQEYARLLKVAYEAVKQANLDAQVLFGGAYWQDAGGVDWVRQVLTDSVNPGKNYYDIANFHLRGSLQNVQAQLNVVLQTYRTYGKPDAPLWITESGYPASPAYQQDPQYRGSDQASGEQAQAEYYKAALPMLVQNGVAKVFVTLRDQEADGNTICSQGDVSPFCSEGLVTFSLQTASGRDRPAMAVYQSFGSEGGYGVSLGAVRDATVMPGAIQLAGQAGIGWLRISISYNLLKPTVSSPYRFEEAGYDAQIAATRKSGLQILATLAYVPGWNSTAPPNPPPGVDPSHFPPADYNAWADYVYQTVSRYKNDIHSWEVWNEPDLQGFWHGTPQQYAELLAVSYQAIKRADPNAKVLLGGLAMGEEAGPFLSAILGDARYPAAQYFDIMNVHSYSPKEIARQKIEAVRSILSQYGASAKPLWITESGYSSDPARQTHPGFCCGLEAQAVWLRDMIPFLLGDVGAQKVFWFQLYDYPPDFTTDAQFKNHGLLDWQGNPKPSYLAYRDLIASTNQQLRLTSLILFKKGKQVDHLIAGAKTKKYQLTVTGSGFVSGTQLLVNGVQVEILSLSSTEITANLPPGKVSGTGGWPVQARNPDGRVSNTLSIEISNE